MGSWWLLGQIAGLLVFAYLIGAVLGCGLRRLHDYALRGDEVKHAVAGNDVQPVIEVSGGSAAGASESSRFEKALSHGREAAPAVAATSVSAVELDTPSFSPIETSPSPARSSATPTMEEIARELRAADEAEIRSSVSRDEPRGSGPKTDPGAASGSGERPKFAASAAAQAYRADLVAKRNEAEAASKAGPARVEAKNSPAPQPGKVATPKPKTQWPAPVGKGFVEEKDTPMTFDDEPPSETSRGGAKGAPSDKSAVQRQPSGGEAKSEGSAASSGTSEAREGGVERGKFRAVSVAAAAAAAAAASRSGSSSDEPAPKPASPPASKPVPARAAPTTKWPAPVGKDFVDEKDTPMTFDDDPSPETLGATKAALTAGAVAAGGKVLPGSEGPITAGRVAQNAQDLTRIKGIDAAIQARLVDGGVTRYEQIAGWQSNDVSEVEAYLASPDIVSRGNWIEQADILARGGSTIFSRMKDRGEGPPAGSSPTAHARATTADTAGSNAPQPPPLAVVPKVVSVASKKVTITPTQKTVVQPVRKPPNNETSSALNTSPGSVRNGVVDTPVADNDSGSGEVGLVAGAAASVVAGARTPEPESSASNGGEERGADPLNRIAGIDDRIAGVLNGAGITRFEQIANWSERDIGHYEGLLGAPGRVERERWIAQSKHFARGEQVPADLVATSARGGSSSVAAPAPKSEPAPAVQPAGVDEGSNFSGFRSVRSKALRGDDGRRPSHGFDDLKRIRGVGVLIEKKLNSLGATSYQHIANWTKDDIDRVSQSLGFKGRIEQENWVEQARILSAGGQTEFSRRMDRSEKI